MIQHTSMWVVWCFGCLWSGGKARGGGGCVRVLPIFLILLVLLCCFMLCCVMWAVYHYMWDSVVLLAVMLSYVMLCYAMQTIQLGIPTWAVMLYVMFCLLCCFVLSAQLGKVRFRERRCGSSFLLGRGLCESLGLTQHM